MPCSACLQTNADIGVSPIMHHSWLCVFPLLLSRKSPVPFSLSPRAVSSGDMSLQQAWDMPFKHLSLSSKGPVVSAKRLIYVRAPGFKQAAGLKPYSECLAIEFAPYMYVLDPNMD